MMNTNLWQENWNRDTQAHKREKWGTKITEGLVAKSEILCATHCSLNETCSSYLFNMEEGISFKS